MTTSVFKSSSYEDLSSKKQKNKTERHSMKLNDQEKFSDLILSVFKLNSERKTLSSASTTPLPKPSQHQSSKKNGKPPVFIKKRLIRSNLSKIIAKKSLKISNNAHM